MNPRLLLLVFCLAGNVLLAMVLLRPHPAASSPAAGDAVSKNSPKPPTLTAGNATTDAVAGGGTNATDFSWMQFTLADYAKYIKDLRAFGTPEREVRAIVLGAIDASYRPRRAALMPPPKKHDDTKFWVRRNYYSSQAQ